MTIREVTCAQGGSITAKNVVFACRVQVNTGADYSAVYINVVDGSTGDVLTYVAARGYACPNLPSWAAKLDADSTGSPCS